jgi:hypothetical protein
MRLLEKVQVEVHVAGQGASVRRLGLPPLLVFLHCQSQSQIPRILSLSKRILNFSPGLAIMHGLHTRPPDINNPQLPALLLAVLDRGFEDHAAYSIVAF